jgi:hypothetical protein
MRVLDVRDQNCERLELPVALLMPREISLVGFIKRIEHLIHAQVCISASFA